MSIPASYIVQVNPRLITPGGSDLQFLGMMLTKSEFVLPESVLNFGSPTAVGDYFGLESMEYELSINYFLGYTNSKIKPRELKIANGDTLAQPAKILGRAFGQTVQAIQALPEPTAKMSVTLGENAPYIVQLLQDELVAVLSYSDLAELVQDKINANEDGGAAYTQATVVYSSITQGFILKSGNGTYDMNFAVADTADGGILASFMLLTADEGAQISKGTAERSYTVIMEAITKVTQNWVTLFTTWMASDDEAVSIATWVNSKGVAYYYIVASQDPNLLLPNNENNLAQIFDVMNFEGVSIFFGDQHYAAFTAGTVASIDWNRLNGAISFAFKRQSGLAATVTDETDALNLEAKRVNFLGNFATRNAQFEFTFGGFIFGEYKWVDNYINAIWLNNALQVNLLSGLSQIDRAPYTEEGYTLVRAWMKDPINTGLINGVIEPGVTLSELQKAQVINESGVDTVNSEIFNKGYYLQVLDPGAKVRWDRESPLINLWYSYGGSINRLSVASTAIV